MSIERKITMSVDDRNVPSESSRPKVLTTVTKNAVANLLRVSASWLVVLLLPPVLVRVLSKPTYATWMLILQVGAYVSLFDNGIQSAIGRFTARAEELRDRDLMQRTLSSAAAILLAGCLIAVVGTALFSWHLGNLFHGIPSSIMPDAQKALMVIGLSLALNLPFSTFAGAFLGLQRNEINAIAGSCGKLIGAAGAAWAAWHHESLFAMALWIAGGNVVQNSIYLIAGQRLALYKFLHRVAVSRAAIREFLRFCYAMFATQLGSLLITGLDMPIVAAFDFHSAGYYAVAATAGNMLGVPQSAIIGPLIPVASGMSAVRSPESLGSALIRVTRYANGILCIVTLPLLFAMSFFLHLWVGKGYATHALIMAIILVVAQFVRLTLMPYAAMGFAAGQQQRMLISPLGEGIVNLGCSIAGAIWLGAIGVALGTLIGAITGVLLHFVNSMPRTDSMGFSRRRLLHEGILRPVACCFFSMFLMAAALGLITNGILLFASLAAGECFAVGLMWRWNFGDEERSELRQLAKKMYATSRRVTNAQA